jgi:anti-anti-sigma regulatory factor
MAMEEAGNPTGSSEKLSAVADLQAAGALKARLEEALAAGASLSLDASDVQRVSSPYLQVLAAGVDAFAKTDGSSLEIVEPSEAFAEAVTTLGLTEALGLKWARQS